MASKGMCLLWGSGSAPCWRPMIVLAEKGLWKEGMNKRLDFSKGEHKMSEVLALNSRGQLPTFRDGDVIVNESAAICLYLEEKYFDDKKKLIPTDVKERAKVLQRMFEVSNVVSNVHEPLIRYRYMTKKDSWDLERLKESTNKAKEELDRWDKILGDNTYLCGDIFTLADVLFFPYLALLVRSGATLPEHPQLKKYYKMISERPSIQATWPPHWKEGDGPGYFGDLQP